MSLRRVRRRSRGYERGEGRGGVGESVGGGGGGGGGGVGRGVGRGRGGGGEKKGHVNEGSLIRVGKDRKIIQRRFGRANVCVSSS